MTADTIEIRGLEIDTRIGVPEGERAHPQRLLVDITLSPRRQFHQMADRIDATVDYFSLSQEVVAWSAERPRLLIETLADEIATRIVRGYPVTEVTVSLRKFILPNTQHVAVRCTRTTPV